MRSHCTIYLFSFFPFFSHSCFLTPHASAAHVPHLVRDSAISFLSSFLCSSSELVSRVLAASIVVALRPPCSYYICITVVEFSLSLHILKSCRNLCLQFSRTILSCCGNVWAFLVLHPVTNADGGRIGLLPRNALCNSGSLIGGAAFI